MWNFWRPRRKWTNRRMSFVAILIATSVAFIIVFTRIIPLAALPTFKLMIGGLPIKLTGYIFGPVIGALTGVISDLISFLMTPTFLHPWYTLAFAMAGIVPGVVGHFMNRRWKKRSEIDGDFTLQHNKVNFIITIVILSTIILSVFIFFVVQGDEIFAQQRWIRNKWIFIIIALAGTATMLVAVIVFWFVLKPKTFNIIIPIIAFSALLEIINTPLTTLGDLGVYETSESFIVILTGHLLLSPIKTWMNMLIIYTAYRIVSPLIYNKTDNGW